MPPGTPYGSFVKNYRIRVDDFTGRVERVALHLLTHTHTDHLTGLSAQSFGQRIVCSPDAKEMLLRHEVYNERALKDLELRAENFRTFNHLKVEPRKLPDGTIDYTGSRDLLVSSSSFCSGPKIFYPSHATLRITDAFNCSGQYLSTPQRRSP